MSKKSPPIGKMHLSEFDFDLPESFIAQNPVFPRDRAKMMVLNKTTKVLEHSSFFDLPNFLKGGDVLVVNNSKVIPARILFNVDGKQLEIFLLSKDSIGKFICLVKPGKRFKESQTWKISDSLTVNVQSLLPDGTRLMLFKTDGGLPASDELIFEHGATPLPPYIKHSSSSDDDYQTVYAKSMGSVAAPTAGLHFTDDLIKRLEANGVHIEEVVLHVGLGTFLPVKTENILDHHMHKETFSLSADTAIALNKAKKEGRRIIAVGTTSVRVLESSFIDGQFKAQTAETDIYIYPGYNWKCVDGLITNFHLPKSTLLMLVSSFAGKDFVFHAYEEAKKHDYRFFSFGDGMLIL